MTQHECRRRGILVFAIIQQLALKSRRRNLAISVCYALSMKGSLIGLHLAGSTFVLE
jgi:hypothetical protein